jgi:hypothetical protein
MLLQSISNRIRSWAQIVLALALVCWISHGLLEPGHSTDGPHHCPICLTQQGATPADTAPAVTVIPTSVPLVSAPSLPYLAQVPAALLPSALIPRAPPV